jgi:hypothetical protein
VIIAIIPELWQHIVDGSRVNRPQQSRIEQCLPIGRLGSVANIFSCRSAIWKFRVEPRFSQISKRILSVWDLAKAKSHREDAGDIPCGHVELRVDVRPGSVMLRMK